MNDGFGLEELLRLAVIFFQHLTYIIPYPPCFYGFCWEICCYSDRFAFICYLLLLSWSFQHSFLVLHAPYFNYDISSSGSSLVFSVVCPTSLLYLNGCFFLIIWDVFSYYFIEYVFYPFSLALFSFFYVHNS
jgi:hypothetical protein